MRLLKAAIASLLIVGLSVSLVGGPKNDDKEKVQVAVPIKTKPIAIKSEVSLLLSEKIKADQERIAAEEARLAAQRAAEALQRERARVAAVTAQKPAVSHSGDVFDALARCESGMTNANTGNGYFGFFQFLPSTWRSMGESGLPTDHSYEVQKAAAKRLVARSGWQQFPGCARKLGML